MIDGLDPAEEAPVSLTQTVLKWNAFSLATCYRVTIWRTERRGGGTYFNESYHATTTSPHLSLSDVPGPEIEKLGLRRQGTTGAWSVDAYDSNGKWIARSRKQRGFVVSSL